MTAARRCCRRRVIIVKTSHVLIITAVVMAAIAVGAWSVAKAPAPVSPRGWDAGD